MDNLKPKDVRNLNKCLEIISQSQDGFEWALHYLRGAIQKWPLNGEVVARLLTILLQYGLHDEYLLQAKKFLNKQPRADVYSAFLFSLQFMPKSTPQSMLQEHVTWNKRVATPYIHPNPLYPHDRSLNRRLKIGYVSPNFASHCQTLFTWPLFKHHHHEEFEIFCYSLTPQENDKTLELKQYTDHWRYVRDNTDEEIAELIRQDRIDILVDLTMHMANNRIFLFAQKPAPVQVAWLAYPGTTGLETMDYRLTDPYLDPPEKNDAHYVEKTLHLPHTFWCYDPTLLYAPDLPSVSPLPALEKGYITFGELNNHIKVNPATIELWLKVLEAVPHSRLRLLSPSLGRHNEILKKRFGGRLDIIHQQHRDAYIRTYHQIDIGLDTFPSNGHTTSLDAYWMGVPVVTLVGQTVTGRAGLSQLTNLQMTELVAWNQDQYIDIVSHLASDLNKLSAIRQGLRERLTTSPLMDGAGFAKDMETAYRSMWKAWVENDKAKE